VGPSSLAVSFLAGSFPPRLNFVGSLIGFDKGMQKPYSLMNENFVVWID